MIYQRRGISVRDATQEHVNALKGRLRKADAKEIWAAGFDSDAESLDRSLQASVLAYALERRGLPVAVFGIAPAGTYLGTSACVWLLGSKEISEIPVTFVKLTIPVIEIFLLRYPVLFNYVDNSYVNSIKWLKSMGAQFEEPIALGRNGELFSKFTLTREDLWERRRYRLH